MKILSFIKAKDMLGESINFSINNQSNFQTVVGGFFCIIFFFLYIIFFYYFGSDFFFKQNPNTNSQYENLKKNDTTPKIDLYSSENFIFGIRFEYYNSTTINIEDFSFPSLTLKKNIFHEKNRSFTDEELELDMVNCNRFPHILKKIPNSMYNLSDWRCPDFSKNNGTIQLGGYWDDQTVNYLKLDLRFCSKNSANLCKDKTSYVEKLKNDKIYISMIFPEIIFNNDDYLQPFTFRFKNYWNPLSSNFQYTDEVNYGYTKLSQDTGLIFENIEDKRESSISGIESKLVFYDQTNFFSSTNTDLKIYSLSVYFDKYYFHYVRKYMKLQEILGNLNGFMDLIIFLFAVLYKLYNKYRLDAYLFNRLVLIKEDKNQYSKLNKNRLESNSVFKNSYNVEKIPNLIENKSLRNEKSNIHLKNNFSKELENFKNKKKNLMPLNKNVSFPNVNTLNFEKKKRDKTITLRSQIIWIIKI